MIVTYNISCYMIVIIIISKCILSMTDNIFVGFGGATNFIHMI